LQKLGHEIALAPNFGVQGGAIEMGGMRVYPLYRDKLGQDVLAAHAKHFEADLVIGLYDLWPYTTDFIAGLKRPLATWFPQDSYPPCPTVVERAMQVDYPIAMSKFGVESMKEQGVDCYYIPHGVSVDVYKPLDKAECRKQMGLPDDKFIVLMVAANQSYPSRKAFPENLAAFAEFHKLYPESMLYLHTTRKPRGAAWDGIELDLLVKALGIKDCVQFAEEYGLVLGLPDTEMAKAYGSADVLLSASMGEGFGIPIIEAQSCGLPVITTKFSSMTELTFNGVTVAPLQRAWTAINTWQAVPSIQGIIAALEYIHQRPAEEAQKAAIAGRQAIVKEYAWPVIMDAWKQFLEGVERGEMPSQERLYRCTINGLEFDAYDDKLSFTVNCVTAELQADHYGFEAVTVEPRDVILDIGAHVGVFSIYAAKKWPEARILAYEPSPTNYARLLRNLEMAKVTNVEPFNLAVTADGRDISLSLERGNTGGTSAFRKVNGHLVEQAKSTTLDQIVDGLSPFVGDQPRVKFLKIDAEGTEHEILTSASCLDRIDYLSGELHINSYLEKQGYSIAGLVQHCESILGPQRVTTTSCRMDE
jgi:FkbM family methyltransferase